MAKKYGGYTGGEGDVTPSNNQAPGSWQAPVEVSRQKRLEAWPSFIAGATTEPAMYVYAASQAVATGYVDEGFNFVVPTGQSISRTDYPDLFDVLGEFYGNGDGFSTFNLPNLSPSAGERTFKFTTTSGLTNAQAVQKGKLPSHTHTVQANPSNTPYPSGEGSPPGTPGPSVGLRTSYDGAGGGNVPKRVYMTPLLAAKTNDIPVGCVFTILSPDQVNGLQLVPNNAVFAIGQDVSRTTYSKLFSYIGTLYGSGDGSTTFTLPDLRGVFISHPHPNLVVCSGTAGTNGSGFYPDQFASHSHTWSTLQTTGQGSGFTPGYNNPVGTPATGASSIGGTENRPNNVTTLLCLVVTD